MYEVNNIAALFETCTVTVYSVNDKKYSPYQSTVSFKPNLRMAANFKFFQSTRHLVGPTQYRSFCNKFKHTTSGTKQSLLGSVFQQE